MNRKIFACLVTLGSCLFPVFASAEVTHLYYYQSDERHEFQIELLERVILLTNKEFGEAKAVHKPLGEQNHREGVRALSTGELDVSWFTSTKRNLATFRAIKVPLMQGMLSYRPLLTTKESHYKLKQVETINDLRTHVVTGFGLYWDSLMILVHNRIPYRVSPYYQELFEMIAKGRVDYMPRGLSEIYRELEVQGPRYPNLMISEDVALYIPMVIYYYVNVNNERLAERIERGLSLALSDGSYKEIFDKHFGEAIRNAQMMSPRVIILENPLLPEDTPPIKTEWWVPKQLQKVISKYPGQHALSN